MIVKLHCLQKLRDFQPIDNFLNFTEEVATSADSKYARDLHSRRLYFKKNKVKH